MESQVVDRRQWNLKKATLFKKKLNELPQEDNLASQFRLTVQIQLFEVSIFVVFKCQSYPNG